MWEAIIAADYHLQLFLNIYFLEPNTNIYRFS